MCKLQIIINTITHEPITKLKNENTSQTVDLPV